jgi:hypothetical protein
LFARRPLIVCGLQNKLPNKEQVMHNVEFGLLDDEEKGVVDEAKFKEEDHLKHISKEDCSLDFIPSASRETAHLTSVSTL